MPSPRRALSLLNAGGGGGGGYSQLTLLERTALFAGARTAIVLTAGLFPLSLVINLLGGAGPESRVGWGAKMNRPASHISYRGGGGGGENEV
jgi:hypothetical protein